MFHCKLQVLIISSSPAWERAMSLALTPQRFELELKTTPELADQPLAKIDMLVLDEPSLEDLAALRKRCGSQTLLIVCTGASADDPIWTTLCRLCDDIWRTPMPQPLITQTFQRWLDSLKTQKELWLTNNYLESTINSIPDLVWFKDIRGVHLNVNDAFCHAVGKTKEDVIGRGHYYIWDLKQEEYEKGEYVCLETEEMVLKARKTCLFDEKVKSKHGLR